MVRKIAVFAIAALFISIITTFVFYKIEKPEIDYYKGHEYFKKGEYDKAIPLYQKCLEQVPDQKNALKELAYAYKWTNKHQDAIDAFQKYLSVTPADNKIKEQLAETYAWNRDYDRAIVILKEVVNETGDVGTRENLAKVSIWNGDYSLAESEIDIILQEEPDNKKAKLLLAKLKHYSGRAEEAVEVYEELLGEGKEKEKQEITEKDKEEVEELLGEAYMISKDYDSAVGKYRDVLKRDPNNIKIRVQLADALSWEKKYDESVGEYKKILELVPGNIEVKEKLANVFIWEKDYEQAEKLLKEILKDEPDNLEAYASLGQILTWDKRYSEAIYYFDLALEKKKDKDMLFLYAKALLFSGDYERSQEVLIEVIEKDSENYKAQEYLADSYTYNKQFNKAILMYENIMEKTDDLKTKEKLADALSWNRKYDESIELYDEILTEQYDIKIQKQKARVMGWARKYDEAISEYEDILDKEYKKEIELEMLGKKAYWNNQVEHAIEYFSELLELDPDNSEVMFDLAQIYSWQSMWKNAIGEYSKILQLSPNHFRAKEALNKVQIIATRLMFKAGYDYFYGESQERDTDIDRQSLFALLRYPINYCLSVALEYAHTWRKFKDFQDVYENEAMVGFTFLEKPCFFIDGYFDLIKYNRGIDDMPTYGADVNLRVFDRGVLSLSYDKERLENSSTVIREGFYKNDFYGRLCLDLHKHLKLGVDFMYSDYSDDNSCYEPGLDVLYYFSFEPKRFTIKYKYFYRDFDDTVSQYFSPKGFSTNRVTFNWRHFLNKEEIFFGANDLYYDLMYSISVDSENVVGHTFYGEIYWDINDRVNFNVKGAIVESSNEVYKDRSLTANIKIYF